MGPSTKHGKRLGLMPIGERSYGFEVLKLKADRLCRTRLGQQAVQLMGRVK